MDHLKSKIIAEIEAQQDESFLRELYELLVKKGLETFHFTKQQQAEIRESEAFYEVGKTISNEELQKNLDDWLDK